MRILFVCSANKKRSRTGEDFMPEIYPGHEWDSAGTNRKMCQKEGSTVLTEDLLRWADAVFVMEGRHLVEIKKHTGNTFASKVKVLGIPDRYEYGRPELIDVIADKISTFIK